MVTSIGGGPIPVNSGVMTSPLPLPLQPLVPITMVVEIVNKAMIERIILMIFIHRLLILNTDKNTKLSPNSNTINMFQLAEHKHK
jgi:hypothetical protein